MRKTNNFKIKAGRHFSFHELQIIGEDINFIDDPTIIAHVVGDKEVVFEGKMEIGAVDEGDSDKKRNSQ